ncbi:AMIN domain-containing protein [Sulfurospirillum barnesii]|uniref:AMIN domain-containing protein n=1 Tax=Sulfurospirillum barnesii (strain ATCC 700032 / DSM 10660 / SES-3) TaxID=760154 RepID=I3Y0L4_SULBS|nr:AMIN domain-containing protein [Sulfurospirillum barnesii]AFL69738.1 hypothetical protein Sulba_2471 [Sulfurospirillum barnesii SES-3]
MQKFFWLFLVLIITLEARENPFKSLSSTEDVGKMTDIEEHIEEFKNISFTLPSSARILKSVTISFQNIDGSIGYEEKVLHHMVDWHHPLVLSHSIPVKEKVSVTPPVSSTTLSKEATEKIQSKISLLAPTPTIQEKREKPLVLAEGISFLLDENELILFTKDSKLRDFLVVDPYKIVLDFKRVRSFTTKTLPFLKSHFVSVTLGEHKDFYRLAILLDGHYRYDLQAFEGGYRIKLK